jgi:putative effector of murein hydrolase
MQEGKTWLLSILIFSIVITCIHYTDNAIYVNRYPEPQWFTTSGVLITWIVMTQIGIISYWLYSKQNYWLSYFLLGMYAGKGLSSPAHYFYGELSQFSMKMHTLIWTDVIAGLSVVAFLIWSLLIAQEWRTTKETKV